MKDRGAMMRNIHTGQLKWERNLTPNEISLGDFQQLPALFKFQQKKPNRSQIRRKQYLAKIQLKNKLEACFMSDNYEEKLKYFENFQTKIVTLDKEAREKSAKLDAEFEARKETIQKEFQGRATEIWKDTESEKEKYKAELKAWCGITDGEPANILDLLKALRKVAIDK